MSIAEAFRQSRDLGNFRTFCGSVAIEIPFDIRDSRIPSFEYRERHSTVETATPNLPPEQSHPLQAWPPTRSFGRSLTNSSAPSSSNSRATAPRTRNPQSPTSAAMNTTSQVSVTDKHVRWPTAVTQLSARTLRQDDSICT